MLSISLNERISHAPQNNVAVQVWRALVDAHWPASSLMGLDAVYRIADVVPSGLAS